MNIKVVAIATFLLSAMSNTVMAKKISVVTNTYAVPGTDCSFYRVVIFEDGNNNDPTDDYPVASKIIPGFGCDKLSFDDGDELETITYASITSAFINNEGCDVLNINIFDLKSGDFILSSAINLCIQNENFKKYSLTLHKEETSLYPTISNDYIELINDSLTSQQIQIFNQAGQLVMDIISDQKKNEISISSLNTGLYFVKVLSNGSEVSIHKFIKS